ncbi:hypothetical protein [Arcanobacterium hippocoleae]
MHPAFVFFLGLFIGTATIAGIWYTEYWIRHAKARREIEAQKSRRKNT